MDQKKISFNGAAAIYNQMAPVLLTTEEILRSAPDAMKALTLLEHNPHVVTINSPYATINFAIADATPRMTNDAQAYADIVCRGLNGARPSFMRDEIASATGTIVRIDINKLDQVIKHGGLRMNDPNLIGLIGVEDIIEQKLKANRLPVEEERGSRSFAQKVRPNGRMPRNTMLEHNDEGEMGRGR